MTPDEYCQQKAASSGSSFYYAFLFLPAERRRAIPHLHGAVIFKAKHSGVKRGISS